MNGKVTMITAQGGWIECTDSTAGGCPTIPFVNEDIRTGAPGVGSSVSYHVGHDSSGRTVAKAIAVASE